MHEIKLLWSNKISVGEEPGPSHSTSIFPSRRNLMVSVSLITTAVTVLLWSLAPPQFVTVIVAPLELPTVVASVNEKRTDECLKRYDGRRLWTRDLTSFEEPSCRDVLEDEGDTAGSAADWIPSNAYDDESLLELAANCTLLRNLVAFPEEPNSHEEAAYPLAYVITAQEDAGQTLRFLRNVYWPQNFYCFALSPDAALDYRIFLYYLTECFNGNVMAAGGKEPAELSKAQNRFAFLSNIVDCFRLLSESQSSWNYVQIVSSEDFPLKTNLQLVKILPLLSGSNDCGLWYSSQDEYYEDQNALEKGTPKTAPKLILFTGNLESALSRDFVNFLLENTISKSFLRWLNGTSAPELYYFSTLMHNTLLHPPGGFPGSCLWFYSLRREIKQTMSRVKIWDVEFAEGRLHCRNIRGFVQGESRSSCRAGVKDVAWYIEQPHLLAHRFDSAHEPAALYCLEKWHWKRICENVSSVENVLYESMQAVRYANASDKPNYLC